MPDNDTEYDEKSVFSWSDEEIENALRRGTATAELTDYFGPERLAELQTLIQEPRARHRGPRKRVLIVPGTLGSQIGSPGTFRNDIIWFGPFSVARGRISELSLDRNPDLHQAMGAIPYYYLKLRLRLWRDGFDVDYFDYDWRYGLKELGERFAEYLIEKENSGVNIVAHSMGGLVSRVALSNPEASAKVARLIMLGTPHYGSFNAIQMFDGIHDTTSKVAKIDLTHDVKELIDTVFSSFPSVYELLPDAEKFNHPEYYNAEQWTGSLTKPRPALLQDARNLQSLFAEADERFYIIASGTQPTLCDVKLTPTDIIYADPTNAGDGTVPLVSALLEGVKHRLVDEEHTALPNNETVAEIVTDLLNTDIADWQGETRSRVRASSVGPMRIKGKDLRARQAKRGLEKIAVLSPAELRSVFDSVSGSAPQPTAGSPGTPPPPLGSGSSSSGSIGKAPIFKGLSIGHRPSRRIEIVLAQGSLVDVDSPVDVVGIFQNVRPGGAAGAFDVYLDRVLSDLTSRRMYDAQAGQMFILPTPGRLIPANMLLLAGLGHFDQFNDEQQEFVAANIIRILTRCRIDEFATVLFGNQPPRQPEESLRSILKGFLKGLEEEDRNHRFRRITICEINPEVYARIRTELLNMALSGEFSPTEVVLDELQVETRADIARRGAPTGVSTKDMYLSIRTEETESANAGPSISYEFSLLTPRGNSTVYQKSVSLIRSNIDTLLAQIGTRNFDIAKFGAEIEKKIFDSEISKVIADPKMQGSYLTIVHDALASRIPWESLRIGDYVPALQGGMSRRYVTAGQSVARWLQQRRESKELEILLVVNPTEDLDGAEEEANNLVQIASKITGVKVTQVRHQEATRDRLRQEFSSGKYDVIHYAGHAQFKNPNDSGILCSDGMLTNNDLAQLASLPALFFCNACESGRIRNAAPNRMAIANTISVKTRLDKTMSFAETFLTGGIAHFIGTYWPVGDASAKAFAEKFYTRIAEGAMIGSASTEARVEVSKLASVNKLDWANYIHYGDPTFTIKISM